MSNRPTALFLEDIREAIAKIERYVSGLDQAGFEADDKTVDAVVRNLGEAVGRLPEALTQRHPQIEWRKIAEGAGQNCERPVFCSLFSLICV